jgi:riboflavin kinase / FMN adenylyltransferase
MKKLYRSRAPFPAELHGGVVAVGNFDGVHQGHRVLIEQLVRLAREVRGPAIVFTFDPSPAELLYPDSAPPALTWMERRAELLHQLGVDAVIAFPTDLPLLELTAQQFFERILVGELQIKGIVEGPNFRFGKGRTGDVAFLQQQCQAANLAIRIVQPQESDGQLVSSSRVRAALVAGDVALANQMLLEPYRLQGRVSTGAQRGRQLGFPTANLEDIPVLVPPVGVYAGRVQIDQRAFACAVHIGPNPTFGEQHLKVEVHVIGFQGDLYGQTMELELLDRVREVRKFASVDELKEQLTKDIARASSQVQAMSPSRS